MYLNLVVIEKIDVSSPYLAKKKCVQSHQVLFSNLTRTLSTTAKSNATKSIHVALQVQYKI